MPNRRLLCAVPLLATLAACGGASPPPREMLTRARTVLDEARASGVTSEARQEVEAAEAWMNYATLEARVEPDHPLAEYRARVALEKALRARASTMRKVERTALVAAAHKPEQPALVSTRIEDPAASVEDRAARASTP